MGVPFDVIQAQGRRASKAFTLHLRKHLIFGRGQQALLTASLSPSSGERLALRTPSVSDREWLPGLRPPALLHNIHSTLQPYIVAIGLPYSFQSLVFLFTSSEFSTFPSKGTKTFARVELIQLLTYGDRSVGI